MAGKNVIKRICDIATKNEIKNISIKIYDIHTCWLEFLQCDKHVVTWTAEAKHIW